MFSKVEVNLGIKAKSVRLIFNLTLIVEKFLINMLILISLRKRDVPRYCVDLLIGTWVDRGLDKFLLVLFELLHARMPFKNRY